MSQTTNTPYFLTGDGEMVGLTRSFDWESTKLGPPDQWPNELKVTLDILFHSKFPMFLFWGSDYVCFYNDAYRPSLGISGKHPSILGMKGIVAWEEIWSEIEPLLSQVSSGKGTVYRENQLIPFYRNGLIEDIYWTFSYSPVRNEHGDITGVLTVCNETTKLVQRQQNLRNSELRFRSMAEDTDLYIVTGDETGNATYFNPAWTRLTGAEMDQLTGFGWTGFVHPEDLDHFSKLYFGSLEKRAPFTGEVRARAKEGNFRWLLANATPRFYPDGRFAGYIGIFTDITERKKVEQSAELFRITAENAIDPFILMRRDSSFEYLNPAALEKWGYTKEEAQTLKVPDVDTIFDLKRFGELFEKAQQSTIPLIETQHKNKKGEVYPVEVTVSGITLGGKEYMLAIARDISERKKAENLIKESELRFRLLAEQSPIWVWLADQDLNVQYVNHQMLHFLGLKDKSEFVGKVWEEVMHPEDIPKVYQTFAEARKYRESFYYEHRIKEAATGQYYWFKVWAMPKYEEDNLVGFIGTAVNIDEQKAFTQELEKKVAARTKDLANSNKELEEMNKELESFAYVSSHDLQEPLRKIQIFSSQILSNDFDNLSERSKDKFKRMQLAAQRMQSLIRDLLAYSRTNSGDRSFEFTNLNELAGNVVASLQEELEVREAVVKIGELPSASVVPFQFEQLLFNLISNSLKFVENNTLPKIQIHGQMLPGSDIKNIKIDKKRDYCCLDVSDNGIGFDQKYADRIFEVFQRLHPKETYMGTGIGLSIVKKIVENHNGVITVTSAQGKGTNFRICIPVVQE
ncbi:PAS domain-containing sensor histidine kinase [Sediminicola sp. 1XM1-17]|uniref:PAS domain-containing sensor histidine kinase n=1 Tax=Sediminicola sp. 1XM1-17 TaxID=3127702 RepID=UPI003076BBBD